MDGVGVCGGGRGRRQQTVAGSDGVDYQLGVLSREVVHVMRDKGEDDLRRLIRLL